MRSETRRQDNWQVETRRRNSGKLAGSVYKVWTSPQGTKYYSLNKAKAAGFDAVEANPNTGEGSENPSRKANGSRKRQKKA